jgi:hypothetical protein
MKRLYEKFGRRAIKQFNAWRVLCDYSHDCLGTLEIVPEACPKRVQIGCNQNNRLASGATGDTGAHNLPPTYGTGDTVYPHMYVCINQNSSQSEGGTLRRAIPFYHKFQFVKY